MKEAGSSRVVVVFHNVRWLNIPLLRTVTDAVSLLLPNINQNRDQLQYFIFFWDKYFIFLFPLLHYSHKTLLTNALFIGLAFLRVQFLALSLCWHKSFCICASVRVVISTEEQPTTWDSCCATAPFFVLLPLGKEKKWIFHIVGESSGLITSGNVAMMMSHLIFLSSCKSYGKSGQDHTALLNKITSNKYSDFFVCFLLERFLPVLKIIWDLIVQLSADLHCECLYLKTG